MKKNLKFSFLLLLLLIAFPSLHAQEVPPPDTTSPINVNGVNFTPPHAEEADKVQEKNAKEVSTSRQHFPKGHSKAAQGSRHLKQSPQQNKKILKYIEKHEAPTDLTGPKPTQGIPDDPFICQDGQGNLIKGGTAKDCAKPYRNNFKNLK